MEQPSKKDIVALLSDKHNSEVIGLWLHEISGLDCSFFNNNHHLFLKARLKLDILEKLISQHGWINSRGKVSSTLEEAEIVDVFEDKEAQYTWKISGNKVLIRKADSKVDKGRLILRKSFAGGTIVGDFDYLLLYVEVGTSPGQIALAPIKAIKELATFSGNESVEVPLESLSKGFVYRQSYPKVRKIMSLDEAEFYRLYKLFRNRVCDSISTV